MGGTILTSTHQSGADGTPPGSKRRLPLRLGLISDTHGVLCPEVLRRLAGVDLILHAGDVGHHGGAAEVLARLATVAPVCAVRGNVDDGDDDVALSGDGDADTDTAVDVADGGGGAGATAAAGADGDVIAFKACGGGGGAGGGGDVFGGSRALPSHRLMQVAGWRILVTHIVGQPPQAVDPAAAELIRQHQPHVVVFGHSHKHLALAVGGVRYYNPGSAGPARFKLPRTAALLELPPRGAAGRPTSGGPVDAAGEPEPSFTLLQLAPKAPPRLAVAAAGGASGGGGAKQRQRRTRAEGAAAAIAADTPGCPGCAAQAADRGVAEEAPPAGAAAAAVGGAGPASQGRGVGALGGGGGDGGTAEDELQESRRGRTRARVADLERRAASAAGAALEGKGTGVLEPRGPGSGCKADRGRRRGSCVGGGGGSGRAVGQAPVGKRRRRAAGNAS